MLTEQTDEPEVPAPTQFFADNDLLKTKVFGKSYEPDNSRFTYILIDESDSLYVAARWYQAPDSTVWFDVTVLHENDPDLTLKYGYWSSFTPSSMKPSCPPDRITIFSPSETEESKLIHISNVASVNTEEPPRRSGSWI